MTQEKTAQASPEFGKIDFMKARTPALILSLVLLIGSLAGVWIKGLNLGVDFTGGTIIEVSYPQGVELNQVREQLTQAGYDSAQVQHFGSSTELMIRIAPRPDMVSATLSNEVMAILQDGSQQEIDLRRV